MGCDDACDDACDEHCGVGEARNPMWSCRTSAASAGDTNESACGSIWVYVSTCSGTSLVEALRVKSFIFLPLSADVSASDILVMMMMLYWELIELLCLVLWENTLALIFDILWWKQSSLSCFNSHWCSSNFDRIFKESENKLLRGVKASHIEVPYTFG